jgi:hypothetical protein
MATSVTRSAGWRFARRLFFQVHIQSCFQSQYLRIRKKEYALYDELYAAGVSLVKPCEARDIMIDVAIQASVHPPALLMPSSLPWFFEWIGYYDLIHQVIHLAGEAVAVDLVLHELSHHVLCMRKIYDHQHGSAFLSVFQELIGYYRESYLREEGSHA